MVGVSSLGVGSGLDLQSLVNGLVSAEAQVRLGRLDVREGAATEKISAYGVLRGALSDFNSTLNSLTNISSFEERDVTVSDSEAFEVSASLDAPLGSFSVEVIEPGAAQLLTASGIVDITGSAITAPTQDIGGGTLTISQPGQGAFIVEISSSASSLDEIAAAINNADDNNGVSASVITGDTGTVLVLKATDTGSDNAITVSVDDVDGDDTNALGLSQLAFDTGIEPRFTETVQALSAQITVSGQTITSNSGSTFANAITGISITARAATDQVESFTVNKNTSKAIGSVEEFVEAYNALVDSITELGRAGTEEADGGGVLVGDSVLRNLSSQIRRTLFTRITENQPVGVQSLSDIGVRVDREGRLELDTASLSDVLNNSFQAVTRLLASDGLAVPQSQEYQSIAYATIATQPGDLTFNFSRGAGDDEVAFAVDVTGLDLVAARDAINTAEDNFGLTASLILEDDGGGGTQARLVISSDDSGELFVAAAEDNATSNPVSIFTQTVAAELESTPGVIALLSQVAAGFLGSGGETGIINARTEGLNSDVGRIEDERLLQQRRLEDYEARLIAQYSALDLLVSNLQSTGDSLLNQLNSISQIATRSPSQS